MDGALVDEHHSFAAQPPSCSQPLHASGPATALFSAGLWLDHDASAAGVQERDPLHQLLLQALIPQSF